LSQKAAVNGVFLPLKYMGFLAIQPCPTTTSLWGSYEGYENEKNQ
jgi:hypothetical protein